MTFLLHASIALADAFPSQLAAVIARLGQYRRVKFTYLMTDQELKPSQAGF
jgi:hypothetical protein